MIDHISKTDFLYEFFGNFGRDYGLFQSFTDNPKFLPEYINECRLNKEPCFISVQPRNSHHSIVGLEKLFFDFDYADKNKIKKMRNELLKKYNNDENKVNKRLDKILLKRREEMVQDVLLINNILVKKNIVPLVVKTFKGYHIYIYFDKVYSITGDENFIKNVYYRLIKNVFGEFRSEYFDTTSQRDIYRLCRVPLSYHEKNDEECIIVDGKLKPTKIRGLSYYKYSGLSKKDIIRAMNEVNFIDNEIKSKPAPVKNIIKYNVNNNYKKEIRPCFKVRLESGEMSNMLRLAMLVEAFYYGIQTEDEMVEFFRPLHDWDGDKSNSKCRYQVNRFFNLNVENNKCKIKPWRCSKLEEHGFCIHDSCPIFNSKNKRKVIC